MIALLKTPQLTGNAQNATKYHGQGMYQKGVAHRTPHYPSIQKAYTHLIEAYNQSRSSTSHGAQFRPAMLFEYFPLKKINSIPRSETAFRRDSTPTVCISFQWDTTASAGIDLGAGERENVNKARGWARGIAEILLAGQADGALSETEKFAYANYGAQLRFLPRSDLRLMRVVVSRRGGCRWRTGIG